MPTLENLEATVKIDGSPWTKNTLTYKVNDPTVAVYLIGDPGKILIRADYNDWTKAGVPYTSSDDLTADMDSFFYSFGEAVAGLNMSRGLVPGQSAEIIRGHLPSFNSADGFVDIAEAGDLPYLAAAESINIVSSSASDASAGVGLRTLLIKGVDGSGNAQQEIITLNGTTDVQTIKSYLRVNFLVGLTVGSMGWNVGDITATAVSADTVQNTMSAIESLSQSSHYTVPADKTGYLSKVEFNAAKISGGGSPEIEFKGLFRPGGVAAPWLQGFDKKMDTGVVDEIDVVLPTPTELPPRTDIRLQADTDTNSTEVRTRMYVLLIDN